MHTCTRASRQEEAFRIVGGSRRLGRAQRYVPWALHRFSVRAIDSVLKALIPSMQKALGHFPEFMFSIS